MLTTTFPLFLICAAVQDVLVRRIANGFILVLAASFIAAALAAGMPWNVVGLHAATGAGILLAGFVIFAFGLFGGGDAKLLAASALWLGLPALPALLMITVAVGAILALAVLGWSLIILDGEIRGSRLMGRLGAFKPDVPYGFAIAAGALMAYPHSWWAALPH